MRKVEMSGGVVHGDIVGGLARGASVRYSAGRLDIGVNYDYSAKAIYFLNKTLTTAAEKLYCPLRCPR
jgi:hypothetical protein